MFLSFFLKMILLTIVNVCMMCVWSVEWGWAEQTAPLSLFSSSTITWPIGI